MFYTAVGHLIKNQDKKGARAQGLQKSEMDEEASDWDWRRFLSAWERCKAKKGGLATWETF